MLLQIGALLLVSPAAFTLRLRQSENDCVCPSVYQPVCASNGVTFSNDCQFLCAQASDPELTIFSQGPCPTSIDSNAVDDLLAMESRPMRIGSSLVGGACFCSMDYKPVCGSNQKTYGNICFLNCERENHPGLEIASYGECPTTPNELASRPIRPTPYRRSRRVSGGRVKQGYQFGDDGYSCACTREYRPMCATDGKTYSNPCELRCAHKHDSSINFASEGPCEEV